MAGQFLEEEEFDEWLTPNEALNRLPGVWPGRAKMEWIASRLADGLIEGAVGTIFVRDDPPKYRIVLARRDWVAWDFLNDEQFWIAGDYKGMIVAQLESGEMRVPFRAYDVRIDPWLFDERDEAQREKNSENWGKVLKPVADALEAQLKARGVALPTELPRGNSGVIPQPEVNAWYAALSDSDKALSGPKLWEKARVELGPEVKRKQVEGFVAGRPRGRRPGS